MKYIKKYLKFKESLHLDLTYQQVDIMESLNVWHDVLLTSISAEQVDFFETFKMEKNKFNNNLGLDFLSENNEFINSLSSIGLKKSPIQNTDDFECFINKPCRFMFIYDFNSNELENPEYILFQSWNETLKNWEESNLFKVKDDIKKFYDKLSSKTIEIVDGDQNYIYMTTNGNDWELQNLVQQNDIYTRFFRKEELQNIIDKRKIKLNII